MPLNGFMIIRIIMNDDYNEYDDYADYDYHYDDFLHACVAQKLLPEVVE